MPFGRYPLNEEDYSRPISSSENGDIAYVTEMQGLRESQEDEVIGGCLPEFEQISEEGRRWVIDNTIALLQKKIEENGFLSGSTASIVISCRKQIYSICLGDSPAWLVNAEDKGEVYPLHERLHNCNQPDADPRLMLQEGGKRLLSGINLYKSFGDPDSEQYNLSHIPDVKSYVLPFSQNTQFVINACDGLTERMPVEKLNYIVDRILNNNPLDRIRDYLPIFNNDEFKADEARLLTNQLLRMSLSKSGDLEKARILSATLTAIGYVWGSKDNISIAVMPVEPSNPIAQYVAVFDGHCGKEVSKYLSEKFHRVIKKEIQKRLLYEKNQRLYFDENYKNYKSGFQMSNNQFDEFYNLYLKIKTEVNNINVKEFKTVVDAIMSEIHTIEKIPENSRKFLYEYDRLYQFIQMAHEDLKLVSELNEHLKYVVEEKTDDIDIQKGIIIYNKLKESLYHVYCKSALEKWKINDGNSAYNEIRNKISELISELSSEFIDYLQGKNSNKLYGVWLKNRLLDLIGINNIDSTDNLEEGIVQFICANFQDLIKLKCKIEVSEQEKYFNNRREIKHKIEVISDRYGLEEDVINKLSLMANKFEKILLTENNKSQLLAECAHQAKILEAYESGCFEVRNIQDSLISLCAINSEEALPKDVIDLVRPIISQAEDLMKLFLAKMPQMLDNQFYSKIQIDELLMNIRNKHDEIIKKILIEYTKQYNFRRKNIFMRNMSPFGKWLECQLSSWILKYDNSNNTSALKDSERIFQYINNKFPFIITQFDSSSKLTHVKKR